MCNSCDYDNPNPLCPHCQGLGAYVGCLGRLLWFRCIHCGLFFSLEETNEDANE